MKKILVVNKYFYHVGGIEEVVRSLAEIKDSDLNIKILACKSDENLVRCDKYQSEIILIKPLFTIFKTPISFIFFIVLVREYLKADVIHLHSPYPFAEVIVSLLSLFKRKKIIVTYHSDVLKQKIVFFFLKPFIKGLFKRSLVVTTSEFLNKGEMLQGVKTVTIPIGHPDKAKGFTKDYYKNTFCLFVGRLIYYKGIFTLLHAMKAYEGKLKIIGTGPLESEIKKFINDNNLEDKVQLLGFVNDENIDNFYKEASFFVFPSIEKTEAFGIVQIIAMSFGLPVLNTNLPTGVPWVARNNLEAITVKPGDTKELLLAMKRLNSNPNLRKEMGETGRERFLALFEQSKMLDAYKGLYKNI